MSVSDSPSDEPRLTIGELARCSGVAATAIRYYDGLGLVEGVQRSGGRRTFAPAAVERLALIQLLKAGGFSLDEVRSLVDTTASTPASRAAVLAERLAEVEDSIRRLRAIRGALLETIECGCTSLEHCDRSLHVLRASRR